MDDKTNQDYLEYKVNPVLENLVVDLLIAKP